MKTFQQAADNSISKPRTLVRLNIGKNNIQWVNCGSGVWKMNIEASYPEVESELLPSSVFFTQELNQIASVQCDGSNLEQVSTIAAVANDPESFCYDRGTKTLYVTLINYDDPILHNIILGIVYGFSFDGYSPSDSPIMYEGRLVGTPSISVKRDPLFFGKLSYSVGSFTFINTDGFFDKMAEELNIYGNICQVLFGYEDIPIDEYKTVLTGVLEKITTAESTAVVTIGDQRKTLSKSITYSCTGKNALDVITEIMLAQYGIPYTSDYYNITEWEFAKALVPNVTIDIGPTKATKDIKINEIIELICKSVLGVFLTQGNGKYTFRLIKSTYALKATIPNVDILNKEHSIEYDPTEVISSTKIGYSKSWAEGYTAPYTYLYDTTRENTSFLKYKVYNQKEFLTLLTSLGDAQNFSDIILDYFVDIHGTGQITVPMKYIDIGITNLIGIEINRLKTEMLGLKNCEVLSVKYDLKNAQMTIGYRILFGFGSNYRKIPTGDRRVTPQGDYRIVRTLG